MSTEFDRRRFLLATLTLGVVLAAPTSIAFAKDGDDSDNSGSGSDNSGGGSDDRDDDDNSGSGSSGGGSRDDDSDDDDDDSNSGGTSGGGSGSSGGGSGKSGSGKSGSGKAGSGKGGSGKGSSKNGKSNGSHKDASDAASAVKSGKAVTLRKLMSHMKTQYGGKVLDVKLNRGIFRYTYRVKHLDGKGRLQTLRLDALSLKRL